LRHSLSKTAESKIGGRFSRNERIAEGSGRLWERVLAGDDRVAAKLR
jgi:hypothetical protein